MLCHSYTSNARPLLLLTEEEFQRQLDLISNEAEDSQDFKFYMRYNQLEAHKTQVLRRSEGGGGHLELLNRCYSNRVVTQIFKITKVRNLDGRE